MITVRWTTGTILALILTLWWLGAREWALVWIAAPLTVAYMLSWNSRRRADTDRAQQEVHR